MLRMKNMFLLILIHSLYWTTLQLLIAHVGTKIPLSFFKKTYLFFEPCQWENQGGIWNRLFKVDKWKKWIPEGSKINNNIYDKSKLNFRTDDIHNLLLEMRRTELIHWISILTVLIFGHAPRYIKWINVVYVCVSHVPIIITQRYNRPRVAQLIRLRERRGR